VRPSSDSTASFWLQCEILEGLARDMVVVGNTMLEERECEEEEWWDEGGLMLLRLLDAVAW
jgi:hypothetical protein